MTVDTFVPGWRDTGPLKIAAFSEEERVHSRRILDSLIAEKATDRHGISGFVSTAWP